VTRRQVRVAPEFFQALDELLPPTRGEDGAPSAADFVLHELAPAIDALASDYQDVTMPGPHPGTRIMVTTGTLVPYFTLFVAEADDGVAEIYWLVIDHTWPEA
jgi:hypothetical protein